MRSTDVHSRLASGREFEARSPYSPDEQHYAWNGYAGPFELWKVQSKVFGMIMLRHRSTLPNQPASANRAITFQLTCLRHRRTVAEPECWAEQ